MKRDRWKYCLAVVVALLVVYISIVSANPGTYNCYGRCWGCKCWANYGTDPIDDCCGICYNEFWYGYDWVTCCVGGMGCHYYR